jgi:hypothetical protein
MSSSTSPGASTFIFIYQSPKHRARRISIRSPPLAYKYPLYRSHTIPPTDISIFASAFASALALIFHFSRPLPLKEARR